MTRKDFLATLAGASVAQAAPVRPNVLFLLADDLGYGDLGCFGHPHIRTPNLDKLAAEGARLTQFYAAAPVCSPSRAGYLTGRSPSRAGIYDWIPDKSAMHLRRSETSVAALLRKAGYATCHVGKWHLNGMFNSPAQPQPSDHGFDHWYSTQNNAIPTHENPRNFVRNGKPVGPLTGYSSTVIVDEALSWLKARDTTKPYCLFAWFHSPHEIVATASEFVKPYAEGRPSDQADYFGNVTQLDHEVGRLLAAVNPADTMVIFTSDNGPETLNRYKTANRSWGSAGKLRERKLWLYEGGIRVPAIVRHPKIARAGSTVETPVGGVDLLPTLCELAGTKAPAGGDGVSFLPALQGKTLKRRVPLFWHYPYALGTPRAALRDGDWKILASTDIAPKPTDKAKPAETEAIRGARLTNFELYNLREDPLEERNLYKDTDKRSIALRDRLVATIRGVVADAPVWG